MLPMLWADYSISEEIDLQQGTTYERGCAFAYFDEKETRKYPKMIILRWLMISVKG